VAFQVELLEPRSDNWQSLLCGEAHFNALADGDNSARFVKATKLGYHRLYCGSALETTAYDVLLDGAKAATVFTDPPY
jgi:hypothetical protein